MDSPPSGSLGRSLKIALYVGAWIAALLATNPNLKLLALIYMFPMGLAAVFYPPALRHEGWTVIIVCYAVYIIHALFYLRTRTSRSLYLWFAALALLLVCNVAGCRQMLSAH